MSGNRGSVNHQKARNAVSEVENLIHDNLYSYIFSVFNYSLNLVYNILHFYAIMLFILIISSFFWFGLKLGSLQLNKLHFSVIMTPFFGRGIRTTGQLPLIL